MENVIIAHLLQYTNAKSHPCTPVLQMLLYTYTKTKSFFSLSTNEKQTTLCKQNKPLTT